ncbi:MAG TPA: 1-deoxy-D-xylulose-5-phosphate reductoisomerase [Thermomicrobiales bacterium]|nr:1-deoxy-D-xylulose-5-phosphate reductoisomerase [Thermomicrobiales bacterium]
MLTEEKPTTPDRPLGLAILGSTGSVGRQTLAVVDRHPERFRVVALAARRLSPPLQRQVARYRPELVAISEDAPPTKFGRATLVAGSDALAAAATRDGVDIVVAATSGHAAIVPTYRAIAAGKTIALANKETIVCAGALIVPFAAERGVELRPVDSEHSAIWQALRAGRAAEVRRLILTASGGPFRSAAAEDLARVTVEQALAHPTWSMGGKVTIDSATMMNKGLEIIEARWLFDVPAERIDVLIHPESIVHSLVEFIDGSQLAQLGMPDMRLPIQYALSYPERWAGADDSLSLADLGALHFERPDETRFPALRLAREAGRLGSTYPTVLSAADDVAVAAFLDRRLQFTDIPRAIEATMARHQAASALSFEAIADADAWARRAARETVAALARRRSG